MFFLAEPCAFAGLILEEVHVQCSWFVVQEKWCNSFVSSQNTSKYIVNWNLNFRFFLRCCASVKQQNKRSYPTPSIFKWNPDLQPATCDLQPCNLQPAVYTSELKLKLTFNSRIGQTLIFSVLRVFRSCTFHKYIWQCKSEVMFSMYKPAWTECGSTEPFILIAI